MVIKYPLFVLLLLAGTARAQELNLAGVTYEYNRLQQNDTTAHVQQISAYARFPLSKQFGGSVAYRYLHVGGLTLSWDPRFQGISLQLAWKLQLTAKQVITIFSQAGVFSDMEDVTGKDWRYGLGMRYQYEHGEKLTTGWGLMYNRQFFGNQLIPFIDVRYAPNDRWAISGQFPVKPKVLYHVNGRFSLGLEISAEAASYRLSAEKQHRYLKSTQWAGLGRMEWQFTRFLQLNVAMGSSFVNRYQVFEDAGAAHWTIITVPVGKRPEPVFDVKGKGLTATVGVALVLPGK